MVNLEALANDLRAAGGNVRVSESMLCLELPYDLMAPLKTVVVVHDNGAVTLSMDEQGRPRSTVYVDQKLNAALAIIARHFGAGQPVAADRAALVERMAEAAWNENDRSGRRFERALPEQRATYLRSSSAALAAVEAAGWGPRAETVAGTGETLYRRCDACLGVGYLVADADCDVCDGEGYVPVAPPEPLSAGELDVCAKAVAGLAVPGNEELIYVDPDYLSDYLRPIVCAVLAKLPARHAVPVEGA